MPRGRHAGEQIPSVSVVILHIIEETAAHTGHLESVPVVPAGLVTRAWVAGCGCG